MLHYFNPGHETAVLNASKYYMPAANQVRMQQDLAYLPAWYASSGDYVFTDDIPFPFLQDLPNLPRAISKEDFIFKKELLSGQEVSLWGLSPQSIHLFEQLNKQYDLHLQIPEWKDEYRPLSSRHVSRECLLSLVKNIPEIQQDILPEFYSNMEEIEDLLQRNQYLQLVKTPYSSSGRGLLWLPSGKLADSSRQILQGMLKKQATVSIEKALNKQLDFSMHFTSHSSGEVSFSGYSIFQTNAKGAYEGSLITPQELMEEQILSFIRKGLLIDTKKNVENFLKEKIAPVYQGCIGVDMLIYETNGEFFLHPCLEINMRKSMGYLALQLHKKYLNENAQGYFFISYNAEPEGIYNTHIEMKHQYPIIFRNEKIESGYLSLCPVNKQSNYRAYIVINLRT